MTKEHQLLKEAAEIINSIVINPSCTINDDNLLNAALKIRNEIRSILLSQPLPEPVTALSWEQALDNILEKEGYRNYAHFNDNPERLHNDWDWHFEKISEAAHLFMEANRVSRWILVEERLPEKMKGHARSQLCLYKEHSGKLTPAICFYARAFEEIVDDPEGDGDFDHNPDKGECYLKEGWYEMCEQRQSEYDFIYLKRNVVLWQPLPVVREP